MDSATPAEVSVIIVNYGTAALAIEAVESVRARRHGGRVVDIHLVDNDSPGDDTAILAEAHRARGWGAQVTLHLEPVNHGFGRGNNLVLKVLSSRETPPDKVFLLNPDAKLDNEALAILADFLDTHPEAACAGPRITKPDGTLVTAAFRFPSLISEFSDTLAFGPVARLCARHTVPLPPDIGTMQVDWVSGAAVMFRREALDAVDGFDPVFFLYFEEVDLMRRLTTAGWQVWHVDGARVLHAEGIATGVRSSDRRRKPDYWHASWANYTRTGHGRVFGLSAMAVKLLAAVLNHLIARLRRRSPSVPEHFFSDFIRVALPLMLASSPLRDAHQA